MKNTAKPRKRSILVGDLEIDEILEELDFRTEAVEDAARTLPKLWVEAAKYRVRIMRQRMERAAALDLSKVDAAKTFRDESDGKVTVQMVNEAVEVADSVQAAQAAFNAALQHEEFAKLILEGLRMKKNAIQVTADLSRGDNSMDKAAEALQATDSLSAMKSRLRNRRSRDVEDDDSE